MNGFTDNPVLLAIAALILLLVIAFPIVVIVLVRRSAKAHARHGSVSGMLMEGTVTHTYGEVPALGGGACSFRVVGVQAETPAIGLELRTALALVPVRLSSAEGDSLAQLLESAAAAQPGQPFDGSPWLPSTLGVGVQSSHGAVETRLGKTRFQIEVVNVDRSDAPIGIGIRGIIVPLSDMTRGASVTPSHAQALAAHLRQAAAQVRSAGG